MGAMKHHAILLAGCVMLSGCDPVTGLSRVSPLDSEPSQSCVEVVIRAMPGVKRVRHELGRGDSSLWHPAPLVHRYFYDGMGTSRVQGVLEISRAYDGTLSYRNSQHTIGPPPRDYIDATRPIMRAMEEKLATDCGLTGLPAQVKERCIEVACPPL